MDEHEQNLDWGFNLFSIHPSILPFSCANAYLWLGHGGSQLSRIFRHPLPYPMLSSSSWEILRRSQARWEIYSLQHVLGLSLVLLPFGRSCNPPIEVVVEISWLDTKTTPTGFWWREWAVVLLSGNPLKFKLWLGLATFSPLKKLISAPSRYNLFLYPELMTLCDGQKVAAQLSLHYGLVHLHNCWCSTNTSVHLALHLQ